MRQLMRRWPAAGSLQLDLIAFGIVEVDRRTIAFRTVALDGFADRDPERREARDDGVTVERLDAKAEVVHIGWPPGSLGRDEVEQRGAGPHLHQADAIEAALDLEAQGLLVELHHGRQVADPEHDMIDSFDIESHGV